MFSFLFALLVAVVAHWGPSDVAAPRAQQPVVVDSLAPQPAQRRQDVEHVPAWPVHADSVPRSAPAVSPPAPAPVDEWLPGPATDSPFCVDDQHLMPPEQLCLDYATDTVRRADAGWSSP